MAGTKMRSLAWQGSPRRKSHPFKAFRKARQVTAFGKWNAAWLLMLHDKSLSRRSAAEKAAGIAKSISVDDAMKMHGVADPFGIRISVARRKQESFYSKKVVEKIRATLVHELVHYLELSSNHYVSASAFQNYLEKLGSLTAASAGQYRSEKRIPMGGRGLIEKAFSGKAKAGVEEERERRTLESKPARRKDYEYIENFRSKSIGRTYRQLGAQLGALAARMEVVLGKPGSGLMLIREVGKGKSVLLAFHEIANGAYDKELARLLKRSEVLKAAIYSAPYLKKKP